MVITLLIVLIIVSLLIGVLSALLVMKGQKKKEPVSGPVPSEPAFVLIRGTGGVFDGQSFALTDKLLLGRQPDECQICFPPETAGISGLHCALRKVGAAAELTDLGSSFGTFVNGVRMEPHTPVFLQTGDHFDLAETENQFTIKDAAEVTSL